MQTGNMRFAYAQALAEDTEAFLAFWAQRRAELESARPNPGHLALAALQRAKPLTTLATQNVDGLLAKAGATDVLELHGNLFRTRCQACGARLPMRYGDRCRLTGPSGMPALLGFAETSL